MHPILPAAVVAAAFSLAVADATAQTSQVSPATAATTEGNGSNGFPWTSSTVRRYQQVHSDLTTAVFKSMAFRANGNSSNYTGTRAIDVELFMGRSLGYDRVSRVFDQNYLPNTKMQVLKRQVINMGPQGQNSTPGTFNGTLIKFDQPFPYPAADSLVWEAVVYSNTVSGSFGTIDVDGVTTVAGTLSTTGTGCVATGRSSAMAQSAFMHGRGAAIAYGVGCTNGPSSAPVVISIGATNPNVVLPGIICGGLYTDLLMSFPVGTTSATGTISNGEGFAFVHPNTLGGLMFYSQLHAIDPGLSELIKIANSNGQQVTVPMPDLSKVVKASRMHNNAGGTTATEGILWSSGTSISYALVCRFDS